MKNYYAKKQAGITLIELLLVITLIGILSGVLVSIINPQRQRDIAADGVTRANLTKTCAAIEAYYEGENEVYPEESTEADKNPLHATASTSSVAAFYLNEWLPGFIYTRNVAGSQYAIHVQQVGTTNYFKCNSTWKNVRECADTTDFSDIQDCDAL